MSLSLHRRVARRPWTRIRLNPISPSSGTQVFDCLNSVLVKVLGTQEVQESSVKAYTQYVISVEISNIV
jgi:hypothetical protein